MLGVDSGKTKCSRNLRLFYRTSINKVIWVGRIAANIHDQFWNSSFNLQALSMKQSLNPAVSVKLSKPAPHLTSPNWMTLR